VASKGIGGSSTVEINATLAAQDTGTRMRWRAEVCG